MGDCSQILYWNLNFKNETSNKILFNKTGEHYENGSFFINKTQSFPDLYQWIAIQNNTIIAASKEYLLPKNQERKLKINKLYVGPKYVIVNVLIRLRKILILLHKNKFFVKNNTIKTF